MWTRASSISPRDEKAKRSCFAGGSARTTLLSGTGWKKGSQDAARSAPNNRQMHFWHRALIAAVVIIIATVVAKLADRRLTRRELAPEAVTRYRVIRRTIMTTIVFVGVLSALLVIPQVRAVAGGILASSAVIGLVVGFAAQRTLANVVAGLLIAFTQPLRLGDEVEIAGEAGVVEEIGLTYTFIRARDQTRVVIPNEKLASETIRNSTIRAPEKLAEINVQLP